VPIKKVTKWSSFKTTKKGGGFLNIAKLYKSIKKEEK